MTILLSTSIIYYHWILFHCITVTVTSVLFHSTGEAGPSTAPHDLGESLPSTTACTEEEGAGQTNWLHLLPLPPSWQITAATTKSPSNRPHRKEKSCTERKKKKKKIWVVWEWQWKSFHEETVSLFIMRIYFSLPQGDPSLEEHQEFTVDCLTMTWTQQAHKNLFLCFPLQWLFVKCWKLLCAREADDIFSVYYHCKPLINISD